MLMLLSLGNLPIIRNLMVTISSEFAAIVMVPLCQGFQDYPLVQYHPADPEKKINGCRRVSKTQNLLLTRRQKLARKGFAYDGSLCSRSTRQTG